MKTIVYRGGLVTFSIPTTWVEEYEDEGGAMFYENASDSGTLRLNIMTFSSDENAEEIDVDVLVKEKAKENNGIAVILDEGNALVRYDNESVEDGEKIKIRFWQVYNPVPPSHLRIAIFSYTMLSSQYDLPKFQHELELLDREIAAAQFATQLGE